MSNMLRSIPFEYEPLVENRFFVEFPSELAVEVWKVQSVKSPTMNINSTEIPFMNETNYLANGFKWEPIDITFIDTIGSRTTTQLMEWVRLHAESLTGRQGYAIGYKKNLIYKELDPTGITVNKWTLEQCQIVTADFGNSDYSSKEVKKLQLTVQPWRCIHNF